MNESLWKPDDMLEVGLKEPDDFLKVRETLSRIGVASRKDRTLFQSCHILHKKVESAPLSQIKVISFKEKNEWKLETKYNIGKKKEE